jgi:hypothetical protein
VLIATPMARSVRQFIVNFIHCAQVLELLLQANGSGRKP